MFAFFKSPRKRTLSAIAVASALLLSACETTGTGGGPTINTSKPVPVALLIPKTSDPTLAQSLENAARMAMGDLQNVQVDLRVYDTAGNANTASSMARKAVDDGAQIILGPVYSQSVNAAGLAVLNDNINVLSFSNNTNIAGGNVYVLGSTFQNTANRLTRYAARQNKGDLIVVHSTDEAGQLSRSAIEQAAGSNGAKVISSIAFERSQNGVIAAVPQVKAAADAAPGSSIFLTATTAGALPLFAQLLPEAGLPATTNQYIGLTRWDIPAQTLALPGVQGGWFALPDPSKSQAFQSRYAATYGGPPHPIGGLAYDGIAAIGALVGAGKSNALTGAALTQSAGFQGVNGIFRLRPDGTNERGMAVATIQNKQVVVIDPAPQSFSGAGF